ncbi:MAG: Fis family transcriptional regulator [Gammaproteobacteria bacterium]|nr:Fis family transcriptional regulator [Gammaproteobacteria bacterium]
MQNNNQTLPLKFYIKEILIKYFETIDGASIKNLYAMFIEEVEAPLLQSVMEYVNFNQSKAANILGINRATLRKKLISYKLIEA